MDLGVRWCEMGHTDISVEEHRHIGGGIRFEANDKGHDDFKVISLEDDLGDGPHAHQFAAREERGQDRVKFE